MVEKRFHNWLELLEAGL
ncbi:hypothetical protein C5167_049017 [Papaver somniferum]|uniref:Uncharacterized protein n=1 Tax=Papaver somniferum TaxID=3469 RepID=A0A4Y7KMY8_PAPSO|nr:hypothetical protein C5167_049017 [Papaver somniferum]